MSICSRKEHARSQATCFVAPKFLPDEVAGDPKVQAGFQL